MPPKSDSRDEKLKTAEAAILDGLGALRDSRHFIQMMSNAMLGTTTPPVGSPMARIIEDLNLATGSLTAALRELL